MSDKNERAGIRYRALACASGAMSPTVRALGEDALALLDELDLKERALDEIRALQSDLKVAPRCDWNAGGDPVSGCDNEAGDDGLCARHREALRQLEALNLPGC